MRKIIFILIVFFLFVFISGYSQTSMPCINVNPVNYPNIGWSISSGSCIQAGSDQQGTLFINNSTYQEMKAGQSIFFSPNTHIAPSDNGIFRAYIEKNDYEVVWFEPANTVGSVGEYEKLELGIKAPLYINSLINTFFDTYPTSYIPDMEINDNHNHPIYNESIGINPYNYQDINIQGIFTSPTGKEFIIDGFYMRDCRRINDTFWEEVPTDYNFRLRFAPNEQGKWNLIVKVSSQNNLFNAFTSMLYSFECIASDNPGYLEVGHHKRYLRFNKTQSTYFPIGINTPSPSSQTSWNLSPLSAQVQQDLWTSISENGGNMVSLPFIAPEYAFEWEFPMVYDKFKRAGFYNGSYWELTFNRQYNAWETDKLFDLAKQYGLYIKVWVTPHHHLDYFSTDPLSLIWEWSPYRNHISGVNNVDDFFTGINARIAYYNYIRYMVARWGYSTQIAWWEVLSEIDKTALGSSAITSEWSIQMTDYFKMIDNYRHLVTASFGTEENEPYDYFEYSGDFVNIHKYSNHEQENWDRATKTKNYLIKYNKPFIYGELAENDQQFNGEIEESHPISFHNALWSTAMSGCMGTGMNWEWYALNDQWHLSNMLPLKNFLLNEDFESNKFIANKWTDNENNGDFENYFLVNFSKTRCLGWVHNRFYWWYTIAPISRRNDIVNGINHTLYDSDYSHEDPIPISGKIMKIEGLKSNEMYLIEWHYTTGNGGVFNMEGKQSNIWGKLELIVPDTDTDHPDWAYKLTWIDTKMYSNNNLFMTAIDSNQKKDLSLLSKNSEDSLLFVYPNPGKGLFNIEITEGVLNEIFVINSLGSNVYSSGSIEKEKYLLDISNLKSGTYYLIVITENNRFIRKLIIQK